jgi:hypothetical protein
LSSPLTVAKSLDQPTAGTRRVATVEPRVGVEVERPVAQLDAGRPVRGSAA